MSALKRIQKELATFNNEPLDGINIFKRMNQTFFVLLQL